MSWGISMSCQFFYIPLTIYQITFISDNWEFVATPKAMASISKIAQVNVMILAIQNVRFVMGIDFNLSLESHKLACSTSKEWSHIIYDEVAQSKELNDLDKSGACHLPYAM